MDYCIIFIVVQTIRNGNNLEYIVKDNYLMTMIDKNKECTESQQVPCLNYRTISEIFIDNHYLYIIQFLTGDNEFLYEIYRYDKHEPNSEEFEVLGLLNSEHCNRHSNWNNITFRIESTQKYLYISFDNKYDADSFIVIDIHSFKVIRKVRLYEETIRRICLKQTFNELIKFDEMSLLMLKKVWIVMHKFNCGYTNIISKISRNLRTIDVQFSKMNEYLHYFTTLDKIDKKYSLISHSKTGYKKSKTIDLSFLMNYQSNSIQGNGVVVIYGVNKPNNFSVQKKIDISIVSLY